jgi:RecA-family ATPase
MLAAIAAGRDWFGCRVKSAPVLYVALEGEAGIRQRKDAYQERHGPIPTGMKFMLTALDIRNDTDRTDLVNAIKSAGLTDGVLVLDTLNRAASGLDENASSDMGDVIDALKDVQRTIGGVVLAVHHSGKDVSKGMRGHSSLIGALDVAVEVSRNEDLRE